MLRKVMSVLVIICLLCACGCQKQEFSVFTLPDNTTEKRPAEEPLTQEKEVPQETNHDEPEAEGFYTRALARRNQEFNILDAKINAVDGWKRSEPKEYTIMVYMIGSNLESAGGSAR